MKKQISLILLFVLTVALTFSPDAEAKKRSAKKAKSSHSSASHSHSSKKKKSNKRVPSSYESKDRRAKHGGKSGKAKASAYMGKKGHKRY